MEHIPTVVVDGTTLNEAHSIAIRAAMQAACDELVEALAENADTLDHAAIQAMTQMKNRSFEVLQVLRGEVPAEDA